jgi:hypothetical protein
MSHLESLAHTDSQALKLAEIHGQVKKWSHASYPINMAVYLDILSPIRRISVALQQEIHDPVKITKRLKEFKWTMAKLVMIFENALEQESILTNYKSFLADIVTDDEGNRFYQNVKLKKFDKSNNAVKESYNTTVADICSSIEKRFSNLTTSPVFKHMDTLLDTKAWPINSDGGSFGDNAVKEISTHFNDLLTKNKCLTDNIMPEWCTLKSHMFPIVQNNRKTKYLDIWRNVFIDETIKVECKNVLHVFEIMLITPFTNAKVERIFSKMNRIKSETRNIVEIAVRCLFKSWRGR